MRKMWSFVRSDDQRELVGVVSAHHGEPGRHCGTDIQFHGWRLCSDGARQADSTIAATCSALTVFDGVTSIVMASSVWSLYAPAGN